MRRALLGVLFLWAAGGSLQATSVISCGGDGNALTGSSTCSNSSTYSTILETFSSSLQWNNSNNQVSGTLNSTNPDDPASADGVAYDTTWTAVGLPISVSGSSLELADNYIDVYQGGNLWGPPRGSFPSTFDGNFNSNSTPNTSAAYGDYLLGSGTSSALTINSATPMSSFGFRISNETLSSFDVVIQLLNQSGNVIQTFNAGNTSALANLDGGGNQCTGLAASYPNGPTPCNTAPFIAVLNAPGVYGVSISTTPTGLTVTTESNGSFFLDTFYDTSAVPEPASILLTGAGLVSLLAFARRRNRRQAFGHIGAEPVDKA